MKLFVQNFFSTAFIGTDELCRPVNDFTKNLQMRFIYKDTLKDSEVD